MTSHNREPVYGAGATNLQGARDCKSGSDTLLACPLDCPHYVIAQEEESYPEKTSRNRLELVALTEAGQALGRGLLSIDPVAVCRWDTLVRGYESVPIHPSTFGVPDRAVLRAYRCGTADADSGNKYFKNM